MVFIPEPRFTRVGGTNRKGASGSGRLRVGEKLWRGRYKRSVSGRGQVIVYWMVVTFLFEYV